MSSGSVGLLVKCWADRLALGAEGAVALMQSLIEKLLRGMDSHAVEEAMNFGGEEKSAAQFQIPIALLGNSRWGRAYNLNVLKEKTSVKSFEHGKETQVGI